MSGEDERYWPRTEVAVHIPEREAPYLIVDRIKQKGFASATGQVNEAEGYVLLASSTGRTFYFTVGEVREYLEERGQGAYWPRAQKRR